MPASLSDALMNVLGQTWGAPNQLLYYPEAVRASGRFLPNRFTTSGTPVFDLPDTASATNALAAGPYILAGKDVNPVALEHEEGHVRQSQALGPLNFPSDLALKLSGVGYTENPFEARAYRREPESDERSSFFQQREQALRQRSPLVRSLLKLLGGD